nr:dTDP-4-dehydrorhamnose 3,5-epimerase [Acidihalobacter aeolianus]
MDIRSNSPTFGHWWVRCCLPIINVNYGCAEFRPRLRHAFRA